MKLTREHRTQKPRLHSAEALSEPEEETRDARRELLTPKMKGKILDIKSYYEIGPAHERIVPYTNFLAAVRRCWPELADELKITDKYTHTISSHVADLMSGITTGGGQARVVVGNMENSEAQIAYGNGLSYLLQLAFVQPSLLEGEVKKNKDQLLALLDVELQGTRYAYLISLVTVLWLGSPETQPQIIRKLKLKSDEITNFVNERNLWYIESLAKLFLPDLDIVIPPEKLTKLNQENETELSWFLQKSYGDETSQLEARLDSIFAVGVLSANEASLLADGTVRYVYAKKPEAQRPLPDRTLT